MPGKVLEEILEKSLEGFQEEPPQEISDIYLEKHLNKIKIYSFFSEESHQAFVKKYKKYFPKAFSKNGSRNT